MNSYARAPGALFLVATLILASLSCVKKAIPFTPRGECTDYVPIAWSTDGKEMLIASEFWDIATGNINALVLRTVGEREISVLFKSEICSQQLDEFRNHIEQEFNGVVLHDTVCAAVGTPAFTNKEILRSNQKQQKSHPDYLSVTDSVAQVREDSRIGTFAVGRIAHGWGRGWLSPTHAKVVSVSYPDVSGPFSVSSCVGNMQVSEVNDSAYARVFPTILQVLNAVKRDSLSEWKSLLSKRLQRELEPEEALRNHRDHWRAVFAADETGKWLRFGQGEIQTNGSMVMINFSDSESGARFIAEDGEFKLDE